MKTTLLALVPTLVPALVLALPAGLLAQESRPSPDPAANQAAAVQQLQQKRGGGYLGLFFNEERRDGRARLLIQSVLKGSDAQKLGFRAGDKIIALDGQPFKNGDEFIRRLWSQAVQDRRPEGRGSKARAAAKQKKRDGQNTITVQRGGKELQIKAGLRELDRSPAVGQKAPDFTLQQMDGKTSWTLSKMTEKSPVVLVFGSYT